MSFTMRYIEPGAVFEYVLIDDIERLRVLHDHYMHLFLLLCPVIPVQVSRMHSIMRRLEDRYRSDTPYLQALLDRRWLRPLGRVRR